LCVLLLDEIFWTETSFGQKHKHRKLRESKRGFAVLDH
jgi:hypothetical protein